MGQSNGSIRRWLNRRSAAGRAHQRWAGAQGMLRKERRGWLLAPLALVLALTVLAINPAQGAGAYFTSKPPSASSSGTGPFLWSFTSGSSGLYGAVAYKLSTDIAWHRCTQVHNVTLANLPDGTYSMMIADDVDLDYAAAHGLYNSSFTQQPCKEQPPPEPFMPISVSSLVIDSTPSEGFTSPPLLPTSPQAPTSPATAPSNAPVEVAPNVRMSTAQAKRYTLAAIRKRTGRPVGFVQRRCHRLSKVAFRCRAKWKNRRSVFAGQFRLRHVLRDESLRWTYRFGGRKASRQCLRDHRASCWRRMR